MNFLFIGCVVVQGSVQVCTEAIFFFSCLFILTDGALFYVSSKRLYYSFDTVMMRSALSNQETTKLLPSNTDHQQRHVLSVVSYLSIDCIYCWLSFIWRQGCLFAIYAVWYCLHCVLDSFFYKTFTAKPRSHAFNGKNILKCLSLYFALSAPLPS